MLLKNDVFYSGSVKLVPNPCCQMPRDRSNTRILNPCFSCHIAPLLRYWKTPWHVRILQKLHFSQLLYTQAFPFRKGKTDAKKRFHPHAHRLKLRTPSLYLLHELLHCFLGCKATVRNSFIKCYLIPLGCPLFLLS